MSLIRPLRLLLDFGYVVSTLLYSATIGIISRPSQLPYKYHVLFSTLRAAFSRPVLNRGPASKDGTASVYDIFVKKHDLQPRITSLQYSNAQLLWLGSSRAQNVLLYFHGGAYVRPAVAGHFLVLHRIIEAAAKAGKSLQIAVMQYDLAPMQSYPVQLRQGAAGLRYILEELKVPSEKILIAGDSAGGNLALALLSHLAHPHSDIQRFEPVPKLGGAFLVSPWVNFTNDSPSWKRNARRDYVVDESLSLASAAFMAGSAVDNYNVPLNAPTNWWKDVMARHLGISYGKNEAFASDIVSFAEHLKALHDDVTIVGFDQESHVQSVLNATLGWSVTESELFFREWVLKLL